MHPLIVPFILSSLSTLFSAMRTQGYKRRWLKYADRAVSFVEDNPTLTTGPDKREAAKAILKTAIQDYEYRKTGRTSPTPKESILNLVIEMAVTKLKAKIAKQSK